MDVSTYFNKKKVNGLFGIEIELEADHLPKSIPFATWRVEEDGSLRGEDNAEYVLKKPLDREEALSAVSDLREFLKRYGSVIDLSRRTSTHVHVNMTDMSMVHLFNFITLLYIFEELLVDWCGDARKGNLFCLRAKDAPAVIEKITQYINADALHMIGDNVRYSTVNLASLPKYGSLEIRCLRGTVDDKVLTTWLGVLEHLKKISTTYDHPTSVIGELSELGIQNFAKKALGNFYRTFYTGVGKGKKVLEGTRLVQDLVFLADWDKVFMGREEIPAPVWFDEEEDQ